MLNVHVADLPAAAGTYVVWLRVAGPLRLAVGRLGVQPFAPGLYAYVGSAHGPGGLNARLRRHLRADKPRHWHIDALTAAVRVVALWYAESPECLECHWAGTFVQVADVELPVAGFGASDCACVTHLFVVPPARLRTVWEALDRPHCVTDDPLFTFLG